MKELNVDIVDLFNRGNYTDVVRIASNQHWQTYAAMGLIGKTIEAIEGLERFECQDAIFYTAVSYWMSGDEASTANLLEKISTPHAQNLLNLIRKPQIQVLAQLPWNRAVPHDLLCAAASDSKFQIQNISFHPDDLQNQPYADIHQFCNSQHPPDFYICMMAEWHLIPPNLQELPCPLFGQTADYDLHIQTVYPWLQIFDEFVVTDRTEWKDVKQLVKVPVSTFPKSFGLLTDLPTLHDVPRDIDVFISGTTLHPYHPDKARLYHQVLRMTDINPFFVHGFISQPQYYNLLSHSKLCFTHVRHAGATPTRGLEALSMGCAVAVQKDCVLQLFAGETEGVIAYDRDLAPVVQTVLADWSKFELAAKRGAKIIREEFALPKVASQYLRFLTFLAAKPRNQRFYQPVNELIQKRSVLQKGSLPGGQAILNEISNRNIEQWQVKWEEKQSSCILIDMARELTLQYAQEFEDNQDNPIKANLLARILEIYHEGSRQFPESLVLQFNFIRVSLHFGNSDEILKAIKVANQIVAMPVNNWQMDIMEDVFPWDIFSQFFNYRKYFDLVTEAITQKRHANNSFGNVIYASIHFYLSKYSDCENTVLTLEHLKQASILDPDFPYYRLTYAEQLVNTGSSENIEISRLLLIDLAQNSILFMEAYDLLLRMICNQQILKDSQFGELMLTVNQAERHTIFLESIGSKNLKQLSNPKSEELPNSNKLVLHKQSSSKSKIRVSVILLGGLDEGKDLQILERFSQQTVSREIYEIVWVGIHGQVTSAVLTKADVVLSCIQRGIYHKHIAYNAGLLHTNGCVITICENDALIADNFIALILETFNLDRGFNSGFKNIPQVIFTSRDRTYVTFRKIDAIRIGGFDEQGERGALYTLAHRLSNAGIKQIQPSGDLDIINFITWDFWTWKSGYFKLIPYKENIEIRKLRLSLYQIGSIFNYDLVKKVGISKYSFWGILELQIKFILDGFSLDLGFLGVMSNPRSQTLIMLKRLMGDRFYTFFKNSLYFLKR